MSQLEKYFEKFRNNIIGIDTVFETPFGTKKLIYADWIASGRLYGPIEDRIKNTFGPMVGNTHSEASETGVSMTLAYQWAHKKIKQHVNSKDSDIIITTGSGMTGVINKLQRILGVKVPEQLSTYYGKEIIIPEEKRPVVFITHMEHHSNHTSWLETIADVVVIQPYKNLDINTEELKTQLEKYKNRNLKIGSFSACSNVTGIMPPYHEMAKIMHEYGGYCFVDFAASAPYLEIDMNPENPLERLDAIFFSPHKFLGGPGSSGAIIFNSELYKNTVPDHPGGGTVSWTNRWNEYEYLDDPEVKEDGGTPSFIQTFRVAMAIVLKEKMDCRKMEAREKELVEIAFEGLRKIPDLYILSDNNKERIGVFSFYVTNVHHNLIVKLLNDRYGIQVRGGCSCAGTYGHFLLKVDINISHKITNEINGGDLTLKPGWVRMSIHPTMTNKELEFILEAIKQVVENIEDWEKDYIFDKSKGEFFHKDCKRKTIDDFEKWFEL